MSEQVNSAEQEEIDKLYPEGSVERQVLEYSRGHDDSGSMVHPLLVGAFKLLMGVAIVAGVVSLFAFFSQ